MTEVAAADEFTREEAGAPPVERRYLTFLEEAGRRLSTSLNTRRCAHTAAELITSFLGGAATVVLPPADRHTAEWLRLTSGTAKPDEGAVAIGAAAEVPGLVGALSGFPPPPPYWLDPARAPGWLLPDGLGPIDTLLIVPLPGIGVPGGALVVAHPAADPPLDETAEALVRAFAVRAGAAISAAALYQEQIATNEILTADLLPPVLPPLEGVDLAASLRTAPQASLIGGDFYDVYLPEPKPEPEPGVGNGAGERGADRPDHEPLVLLGDVCGKGIRAAVLAGRIRHGLRMLLMLEHRPVRLVELLNRFLLTSRAPYSFTTLVLGALRPAADGHLHLDLVVAGHPPPLILRRDGTVAEVAACGPMLGVFEPAMPSPETVDLAPGETCLFYSDGITEAFGGPSGGEMYGEERLMATLATCVGMPAGALVERVEQVTSDWTAVGGAQDDRVLLAVQAAPAAGRPR